jgi:twitching motility protein PilT
MAEGVRDIISKAVELGASDIHLTVYRPPVFRVDGRLVTMPQAARLSIGDTKRLCMEMIPNEKILNRFEEDGHVDFSLSYPGIGRIRVNLYLQRGSYSAALRLIPTVVPKLETLGLPPIVRELPLRGNGLILVTGPAGSGKSTTLAAIIDLLNAEMNCTILTLEDPIEYLHRHGNCIINQREVGTDCVSFAQGLRAALRQDPDVILVGEMRDLETISTAVTAAETGHLVMTTLHSSSAAQTIERIIDVFPPHQQEQIRIQLANTLQGIITQQLIPRVDGKGRVLACEILVGTPAVRNLIREGKSHLIQSVIQTGASQGMISMEKSLKNLYQQGLISQGEVKKRIFNYKDIIPGV